MKTPLFLIVLFAGIVLTSCGGGSSSDGTAPSTQKLELTVKIQDSVGHSVFGAYVYVQRISGNIVKREDDGFSDESGNFKLPINRPTDQAKLTIFAAGYEPFDTIYPHTAGKKTIIARLKTKKKLSIISYNILYGLTTRNFQNSNKARFSKWMKRMGPDLVFLQETNNYNEASLKSFAEEWGHTYVIMNKSSGFPCSLTSRYAFSEVKRVTGASYTSSDLNTPQTPRYPYFHHGYLRAKWQGIYLYCIHLDPFHYQDRQWEIDSLIRDIATLPAGARVMVAGDYNNENVWDANTIGTSTYYAEFNKYRGYDPNFYVPNAMQSAGMKDAYAERNRYFKASTGSDSTYYNTTRNRWRIDYIFVSQNMSSRVIFSDIVKDYYTDRMSDHYPNYVTLDIAH